MLAKLVATLPAKIAAAALGGALIVGGGATALAAGNLHGAAHHAAHGSSRGGNTAPAQGKHAHTAALAGTLKAYDAGARTITVDGKKADAGDEHNAGGATSTFTIAVNANTRVNGRHAKTLADLANAIGSKVQVQALDDGKGTLTAWKVTVGDKAGDQGQQGAHFEGSVGSVDTAASTFTLQPAQGNALTIHVSPSTTFEGVQGLAGLKSGMRVEAEGAAQPDGSVAATKVHAHAQGDQGDQGDQGAGHGHHGKGPRGHAKGEGHDD